MLVLGRRLYDRISIGDSITVTVVEISGDQVKLGIEAPSHVQIWRDNAIDRDPKPRTEARS